MSLITNLDELMQKVDSRYTLVVVAAKRARKLTEKKDNNNNGYTVRKPVTEALKEISQGRIRYRRTKQGIK
ncbi:MAG: DNA-directed RNA polymerase subunit omega [Bacillota bacterium]